VTDQRQWSRLRLLLDYLAVSTPASVADWQEWHITPIGGGANNRLFRATSEQADLAIKFTIRDARDRAGREYQALQALAASGLDIAPRAVLLDRDRYDLPVVVQTWLAGESISSPPATDADWQALLAHFVAAHTLTPTSVTCALPAAVLTMENAAAGRQRIAEQVVRLPLVEQPAALREIIGRLERARFPDWPTPPLALTRCDANISNFVRRPDAWASVDWEYSGWGDPALDITDLLTHPAYQPLPDARREWVIAHYSAMRDDATIALRIRVYTCLMLVWWVVRFARLRYETPRGLDNRLVNRPADWQATFEAHLADYARAALAALDDFR
jgi:aminoglycoside phosphotransferase (APT) family kinase protein